MEDKEILDLIESLQIAICEQGHQIGDLKNNLNVEIKRVTKLQDKIKALENRYEVTAIDFEK